MKKILPERAEQKENIMEDYKKEFIEFMIDCEVLKFGDFVTKSGRLLYLPDQPGS